VWVLNPGARQAFVLSEERQAIFNDTQSFESPLLPGFSIRLGDA
jgi:hypothetical protein